MALQNHCYTDRAVANLWLLRWAVFVGWQWQNEPGAGIFPQNLQKICSHCSEFPLRVAADGRSISTVESHALEVRSGCLRRCP